MSRRLPRTRVGSVRILFYSLTSCVVALLVLYKSILASITVQIRISTNIASDARAQDMKRSLERRDNVTLHDDALVAANKTDNTKWQKITPHNELVIFSAYYNKESYVGASIQAILLKREPKPERINKGSRIKELHLKCMLLYTTDRAGFYRSIIVKASPFNIWDGHHHKRYLPGHIYCRLPDKEFPKAVSITTDDGARHNQVLIVYGQLRREPSEFTMCLSPLHFKTKNIDKALVQYFELNKLLGADFFYVYNIQVTKQTRSVLEYYAKTNYTRVIQWNLPPYLQHEDDIWYFAQLVALNDCFLKNKGRSKYLISTDLDEFILPKGPSVPTWKDMLLDIPNHCSYEFHCVIIDMSNQSSVIKNEHRMEMSKTLGLFTLLHQNRHNYILPERVKSKVIVQPDCYDGINVHSPMKISNEDVLEPWFVKPDKAVMYHYASPDAKFIEKRNTGQPDMEKILMPYATDLIKETSNVWRKIRQT